MDMTASIEAKSDQQNAEDYLSGPRTVTIEKVTAGNSDQPVNVHLVEHPGKPYRPSKSMRRVMVAAWGPEASTYAGRKLTLYRDPEVAFGGMKVGGIKISAMSHIDSRLTVALTVKRGQKAQHTVQPLTEAPMPTQQPAPSLADRTAQAVEAFGGLGVTVEQLTAKLGGRTPDAWTDGDLTGLLAIYQSIQAGQSTAADDFGGESA